MKQMEKMKRNIPQGYTDSPIGIISQELEAKYSLDTTPSTALKAIICVTFF